MIAKIREQEWWILGQPRLESRKQDGCDDNDHHINILFLNEYLNLQ
jgi:hypothetical protein